jgi:hypothetical protein
VMLAPDLGFEMRSNDDWNHPEKSEPDYSANSAATKGPMCSSYVNPSDP